MISNSQAALAAYLVCTKRADAATQQALQQLCAELGRDWIDKYVRLWVARHRIYASSR